MSPRASVKTEESESAGQRAEATSAVEIDGAIAAMERLYAAATGSAPPAAEGGSAPIPVERDPAQYVGEQIDRLLATLEQGTAPRGGIWTPAVTILEAADEFIVCVDLPGVERRELEVVLQGNALDIRGRRSFAQSDGLRLRLSERPLGRFARRILLPVGATAGEPAAALREGVLEIRVPKAEGRLGPKSIPVS